MPGTCTNPHHYYERLQTTDWITSILVLMKDHVNRLTLVGGAVIADTELGLVCGMLNQYPIEWMPLSHLKFLFTL